MSHYYDFDESIKSEKRIVNYDFKGLKMKFTTDNGVFSKGGIDFGSSVLINAFIPKGKTLLDVGSGYGTIGISLAKKYNLDVTMVDINERAVSLCKENIVLNKVTAKCFLSNIYENVKDTFDIVISNPPIRAGKDVVHEILVKAYDYLNLNGELWIVIQKKQGAPSASKKMEEVFGNVTKVTSDKGYYILKSVKMN